MSCCASSLDTKSLGQNNPLCNHDRQANSWFFSLPEPPIEECLGFVPCHETKLFHVCLGNKFAEEFVKWAVNRV